MPPLQQKARQHSNVRVREVKRKKSKGFKGTLSQITDNSGEMTSAGDFDMSVTAKFQLKKKDRGSSAKNKQISVGS